MRKPSRSGAFWPCWGGVDGEPRGSRRVVGSSPDPPSSCSLHAQNPPLLLPELSPPRVALLFVAGATKDSGELQLARFTVSESSASGVRSTVITSSSVGRALATRRSPTTSRVAARRPWCCWGPTSSHRESGSRSRPPGLPDTVRPKRSREEPKASCSPFGVGAPLPFHMGLRYLLPIAVVPARATRSSAAGSVARRPIFCVPVPSKRGGQSPGGPGGWNPSLALM